MKYDKGVITADKVLNNLDKFVIDFLNLFDKHSEYVIISGYVSILLGRSRISEDVDLLFPEITKGEFAKIHEDLIKNNFWCLNGDSVDTLYELLEAKHSIRYGINNNPFPNMEIKFIKTKIDKIAFDNKIIVKLPTKEIKISELNLQVAFKEEALKSKKDIEDATHIRQTFKEQIKEEKIKTFKQLINQYGA